MSLLVEYTIVCDGLSSGAHAAYCPKHGGPHRFEQVARRDARQRGWMQLNGPRDLSPQCYQYLTTRLTEQDRSLRDEILDVGGEL